MFIRKGINDVLFARFTFSLPESMKPPQYYSDIGCSPIRRSRSNPIGLEDSDEEDIEVPRFTSLDYQNLDDLECDSDGDLDLPRHHGSGVDLEITIEHDTETQLQDVGLQVWRGSLLLADYILYHHQDFCKQTVLEVGSGTGLASIIASYCGAK